MDVQDAGVALLWMVLIYLFGGNGKSVRKWMKWVIERVVRWEGKREDSNRGKRESVLNYWLHIYILPWVLCIAFYICPDSPLTGLSFGDSHRWNIETEEHPDHLCCHQRSLTLVRGTSEVQLYSFIIHLFFSFCFLNAYFFAMVSCFYCTSPGTVELQLVLWHLVLVFHRICWQITCM